MQKYKIILGILAIVILSVYANAQQIDKITRRCPAPNGSVYGANLVTGQGDVTYSPCPSRSNIFTGNVDFTGANLNLGSIHLIDNAYTISLFPNNFFSIAKASNVNYTGGFAGEILDNQILGNGNGNFFVNQYTNLQVGGASATNANIFGALINVSNRSNSVLIGSTKDIEGVDVFLNMETPAVTGYGFAAFAGTGSHDADGTGTVSAVEAVATMHNGGYTGSLNAVEARMFTTDSTGSPATAPLARNIWVHGTNNPSDTITDWRGISIDSFSNVSGTVGTTYGIYLDGSLNTLGSSNFAFYSLSLAPSLFSGVVRVAQDVYVTDNTKGMVLKSPDGTCYRFTVANGGALSAGAAITCP